MAKLLLISPTLCWQQRLPELSPYFMGALHGNELTRTERLTFERLNKRLYALEQELANDIAAVMEELPALSLHGQAASFQCNARLYFCLHDDDPYYNDDDSNYLVLLELHVQTAPWEPQQLPDGPRAVLWPCPSSSLQQQLATAPHSGMLATLVAEGLSLANCLRIGSVKTELLLTCRNSHRFNLPYSRRLSAMADYAAPYTEAIDRLAISKDAYPLLPKQKICLKGNK
ncbi:hypothetical protein QWY20_17080 [Alkalimonas sp. MEB108]|uniref:Uncharacterized protein n=1 Tax=Alkalimonas cellulosilytica TaxID=3058395 RepID=A0ABU7JBB6_9GAMM|nr:hypothetical protein [Alkalimonas sp. MEB108]MEE2003170.1 hypothetical protein [Alkalimonas sp. MEB108]